jgi:hypothetical protein
MSLSTRNYSKESRSSSHYSRSASYHTSGNNNYSSSYRYCNFTDDDRPLSTRLIERDHSWPSLSWDWHFDDPFFFDRIRWRLDDPLFKWNFGLARPIPIYYRSWNNSTSRIIPVQYTPSSKNRRHPKKIDDDLSSSSSKRPDESSMSKKKKFILFNKLIMYILVRENRISSENWPPKLGKSI